MKLRALALVLFLAPSALADSAPNRWDIAKSPQLAKEWEVHRDVMGLLALAEAEHLKPSSQEDRYLFRARAMLEEVGAATSNDVRLRFDYGVCLHQLHSYARSAEVLKDALAIAPTHTAAIGGVNAAWLVYAFANAYLENSLEERHGYEMFLTYATEGTRRLVPMLNLAETEMRLGNMSESVQGYRDVLQLAASLPRSEAIVETERLATWGLAVSLDRAGDGGAAAKAAQQAVTIDPPPISTKTYSMRAARTTTTILDETGVFFVPAYERKWYLALGETQLARGASDPRVALGHWRAVEQLWGDYVLGARGRTSGDRWLGSAEKRLEAAKKKRVELEKRVGSQKGPPELHQIFIE
jgi:tetratricopeptide (TPR) repeat protein